MQDKKPGAASSASARDRSAAPGCDTPESEPTATVCSACLRASCWHGHFYCDDYQSAGTVEKTPAELEALNREHPSYWRPHVR